MLRIQFKASSISWARSRCVWSLCFGKSWSSVRNVSASSSPEVLPLRSHVKIESMSFLRSSVDRRATGMSPNFAKGVTSSSKLGTRSLLRIQSRAFSMSTARSRGLWPGFIGKIACTLRKSPFGSASAVDPFRSQFKTSSRSFALCSGVRGDEVFEEVI